MQKHFKQKNKSHQVLFSSKGFTLIEALVAISIFTMSLLGIMSILANNITNIEYAKQKMTATYLAQEGIEYVRNLRDTDALEYGGPNGWSNFYIAVQSGPIPLSSPDNFYLRSVSGSTSLSANMVTITSTVCWPNPTNCNTAKNKVSFSENLYNWIE